LTSTERVACALRLQQPDRVPLVEFIIDPAVWSAINHSCSNAQDFMDRMGYDGVCCRPVYQWISKNDDGTAVDEWGVTYKITDSEVVAHPIRGPIESMSDARAYRPPNPHAPHRLEEIRDAVLKYKGKRAIVLHHRAAFMWAAYLMGTDNLLAALLNERQLAEYVMDMVLEANMALAREAVRLGTEVVVLADDYACNLGPMVSPELVKTQLAPRLEKMVELIHHEGALVIKHTDGNIYSILDILVDTGIDGINPVEPVAGMDLRTVKGLVGDRVCLVGNIDCGELLTNGKPDDVAMAVRDAIRDAAEGGGFILSSSNSIHSSVKPENLLAMIKAAHQWGSYGARLDWAAQTP
jgi:uroporphyrinogen decarboxylase